ncbi:g5136 [Coccomyxa elongata]
MATSARTSIFLALLAIVLFVATVRASGGRTLSVNYDSAGLRDCGDDPSAAQMAVTCPADGQRYQLCLSGPAAGGCKLESSGLYPSSACYSFCATTQSSG